MAESRRGGQDAEIDPGGQTAEGRIPGVTVPGYGAGSGQHGGVVLRRGGQHGAHRLRPVGQVAVREDPPVPPGRQHAQADGGALAPVLLPADRSHRSPAEREPAGLLPDDLPRAVGGAVVGEKQLIPPSARLRVLFQDFGQTAQGVGGHIPLVVHGDYDAEEHDLGPPASGSGGGAGSDVGGSSVLRHRESSMRAVTVRRSSAARRSLPRSGAR